MSYVIFYVLVGVMFVVICRGSKTSLFMAGFLFGMSFVIAGCILGIVNPGLTEIIIDGLK